jgi:hypothetical protein
MQSFRDKAVCRRNDDAARRGWFGVSSHWTLLRLVGYQGEERSSRLWTGAACALTLLAKNVAWENAPIYNLRRFCRQVFSIPRSMFRKCEEHFSSNSRVAPKTACAAGRSNKRSRPSAMATKTNSEQPGPGERVLLVSRPTDAAFRIRNLSRLGVYNRCRPRIYNLPRFGYLQSSEAGVIRKVRYRRWSN